MEKFQLSAISSTTPFAAAQHPYSCIEWIESAIYHRVARFKEIKKGIFVQNFAMTLAKIRQIFGRKIVKIATTNFSNVRLTFEAVQFWSKYFSSLFNIIFSMSGSNKSQYLQSVSLLPICRMFIQHKAAGIYHIPWPAKKITAQNSHTSSSAKRAWNWTAHKVNWPKLKNINFKKW